MSKLKIRKKMASKKTPDPTLADDAPCWCESGTPYIDCHKLWDMIHERTEPPIACKKPGH